VCHDGGVSRHVSLKYRVHDYLSDFTPVSLAKIDEKIHTRLLQDLKELGVASRLHRRRIMLEIQSLEEALKILSGEQLR